MYISRQNRTSETGECKKNTEFVTIAYSFNLLPASFSHSVSFPPHLLLLLTLSIIHHHHHHHLHQPVEDSVSHFSAGLCVVGKKTSKSFCRHVKKTCFMSLIRFCYDPKLSCCFVEQKKNTQQTQRADCGSEGDGEK